MAFDFTGGKASSRKTKFDFINNTAPAVTVDTSPEAGRATRIKQLEDQLFVEPETFSLDWSKIPAVTTTKPITTPKLGMGDLRVMESAPPSPGPGDFWKAIARGVAGNLIGGPAQGAIAVINPPSIGNIPAAAGLGVLKGMEDIGRTAATSIPTSELLTWQNKWQKLHPEGMIPPLTSTRGQELLKADIAAGRIEAPPSNLTYGHTLEKAYTGKVEEPLKQKAGINGTMAEKLAYGLGEFAAPDIAAGKLLKGVGLAEKVAGKLSGASRVAARVGESVPRAAATWGLMESTKPEEEQVPLPEWLAQFALMDVATQDILPAILRGLKSRAQAEVSVEAPRVAETEPAQLALPPAPERLALPSDRKAAGELTGQVTIPGTGGFEAPTTPKAPRTYQASETPYNQAMDRLNEGIETIQNHIQHNDVLAAYPPGTTVEQALADLKVKTGIDLHALTADVEKARAGMNIQETAQAGAERRRLARVVGAQPPLSETKISRPDWISKLQPGAKRTAGELAAGRSILSRAKDMNPARVRAVWDAFPELQEKFPQVGRMLELQDAMSPRVAAYKSEGLNINQAWGRFIRENPASPKDRDARHAFVNAFKFQGEASPSVTTPASSAGMISMPPESAPRGVSEEVSPRGKAITPEAPATPPETALSPKVTDKIRGFADDLEAQGRASLEKMLKEHEAGAVRLGAGLDPEYLEAYAKIGAAKIIRGTADFAEWSTQMVKDFGENIKPHLKAIWTEAQRHVREHGGAALTEVPDTSGTIVSKTSGEPGGIAQAVRKAYTLGVDRLTRIGQFDKSLDDYVKKTTGKHLSDAERTALGAYNAAGADNTSAFIMREGLVDPNGRQFGKPFSFITGKIPKGKEQAFEEYMKARHAVSWLEKGRQVYPEGLHVDTPAQARAIAGKLERETPIFTALGKAYDKWWETFCRKWLVDTGYLTEKQYNGWRQAFPHYIKLQRQMLPAEKSRWSLGLRGVGSGRPTVSLIESTLEDIDHIVSKVRVNQVKQSLYNAMEKYPEAMEGWGRIETDPAIAKQAEGIRAKMNDPLAVMDEIESSIEKETKILAKHGNSVIARVKGRPVVMKIEDPELLTAMSQLKPYAQRGIVEATRKITSAMKTLTTGINPFFGLFRNIARDIPTAMYFSKTTSNPVRFTLDLMQAVVDITGKREPYQEYKAIGGGHSSPISADRNRLALSKAEIIPGYVSLKKPGQALKRGGAVAMSYLENLNNILETAPRLAEFKRWTARDNTPAGRQRALYEAQDITVNFKKSGEFTRGADAFFPYLNAAVQGIDKFGRNFAENPARAVVRGFMFVTIPTVGLYLTNYKNPNYQKLSSHVRDNYFCIPNPTDRDDDGWPKTFIKVPKPREIGVLFGSGPERVLQAWAQNDPKAFDGWGQTFMQNFLPSSRSIAAPLYDVRGEQGIDWMGRPIVPSYLTKLSPGNQYDENTSAIARELGQTLKMSPRKIDYLLQSYGGVLGDIGTSTDVLETVKRMIAADPLYSNDTMNDFYDALDSLSKASADYKETKVRPAEYDPALLTYFNRTADALSDKRKVRRTYYQKDMTKADREKLLAKNQKEMVTLAQKAVDLYEKRRKK